MDTTVSKVRVNLSLSPEEKSILDMLAKRDATTPTSKAVELVRQALAYEEDIVLENLAQERLAEDVEYIEHDKFWEQVVEDRLPPKSS